MYEPKNKTKQRQKTVATFIAGLESSNSDISRIKTPFLLFSRHVSRVRTPLSSSVRASRLTSENFVSEFRSQWDHLYEEK